MAILDTISSSPKTSLLGVLVGIVQYLSSSGVTIPQSRNDWFHLVIGVLLAALGISAADQKKQ